MTDILHLQTRTYPLYYGSIEPTTGTLMVPGRGEVRLEVGTLASHAYNPEPTLEADLTDLVRAVVSLPGTEIVSCRARLTNAGIVMLVYALRHQRDLRALDTYGLADFDADINRQLRDADSEVIGEAFHAAVMAGLVHDLVLRPGHPPGSGVTSVDRRAVRYNCHFVATGAPWTPDQRVPRLPLGPRCEVLLPYTYAWDADPDSELDRLITMLEPADIATAQLSLVFSATIGGRRILDELARSRLGPVRQEDLRRFLDRVWASYHLLDFYRLESAQDHRATYLAAREIIGLDRAHARAGSLLEYVSGSLMAESSRRSQQLDSRLNRVAAGLTVVVAASFVVDVLAFLLVDPSWGTRFAIAIGVPLVSMAALVITVLSVRRRRKRRVPKGSGAARPALVVTTPPTLVVPSPDPAVASTVASRADPPALTTPEP